MNNLQLDKIALPGEIGVDGYVPQSQFQDTAVTESKKKLGRPKVVALQPLDLSSSSAIWDNAKKYRNAKGYYFCQLFDHFSRKCYSRMEHVLIWERIHGCEVPSDCCIHHRDLDPGNNNAENLLCIPIVLHLELHVRLRNARKTTSQLEFQVERQRITQQYERISAEIRDLWGIMADLRWSQT